MLEVSIVKHQELTAIPGADPEFFKGEQWWWGYW